MDHVYDGKDSRVPFCPGSGIRADRTRGQKLIDSAAAVCMDQSSVLRMHTCVLVMHVTVYVLFSFDVLITCAQRRAATCLR